MPLHDLSQFAWTLEGWRPYSWILGRKPGENAHMRPDIGPIPAKVPGSAQAALFAAGLLPDWNVGVQSRACEWVEHRHWFFETTVPAGLLAPGERAVLVAEGLDYAGWILVDNREAARFEGALIPHRFDLTAQLGDGEAHTLGICFEEAPPEQGQIGYTSRSRYFKPRYPYSWDWCPRLVPIGVWDALVLETGPSAAFRLERVRATLAEDHATGRVEVAVAVEGIPDDGLEVILCLRDGDRECGRARAPLNLTATTLALDGLAVKPWQPNGAGDQSLYTLEVRVADARGVPLWRTERQVGFKRVVWRPCAGAPDDALPWLCEVNGVPVFLQGANWVPPRTVYHDVAREDYKALIDLYREMGCNVLRVWGGGILEKEVFYDLCDRVGILVWQEFPLSSSGVENLPPEAPDAIDALTRIARSYIQRRAHHASMLLWCGGNELTLADAVPVDESHPCIAALKRVVEEDDPEHRFIPTSPSGPLFYAHAAEYGKGKHHDIHGPWGMAGFADLDAWRAYWEGDDALFRSEVGMPGAMAADAILKYAGGLSCWPPEGEYWQHTAAWWTQWDRFEASLGALAIADGLPAYVRETQAQQAAAYAIAAACCKGRFPRCGGFIIWMGHDCFPCPANNAVIDFDRRPKPAYFALQQVFRS
ncbi:MAG TPA: glycoside hydrolase family 2 TIM barrel-domain containing protein [Candidatus Hydrogenedentes bacterium]|nr:glycoside hydrolase family 2 TIM barrel-domain containing protein [Candidatus Hydrogenedentota bacterium]